MEARAKRRTQLFNLATDIGETMKEREIEVIVQRAREQFPGATPRIIAAKGPQVIAKDFKAFIRLAGRTHVRTAPYDPPSNGVLKLDRDWRTVASIGFGASGDPVFNAVHDLAVARDGSIYVAETRTKRVVKLRPR